MSEEMLKPFLKYLKGKRIICPCDTINSEIYKYLKSNNLNVEQSSGNFQGVDYNKYDVVITNPPFSKMKEFYKYISNKEYIIIAHWLLPSNIWFIKNYIKGTNWKPLKNKKWKNTNKNVPVITITNIKTDIDFPMEKPPLHKALPVTWIYKSNYNDFVVYDNLYDENNKRLFRKVIYKSYIRR